jgi:[protein-PII] uridylyltransferase
VTATPTRSELRRRRAAYADQRLRTLWDQAVGDLGLPSTGAAVVALGGYGRGELSPHSDLDLLLLATDGYDEQDLGSLAERLWYPLWDAGVPIDHAVRSEGELRDRVAGDVRVALGVLDARHVAGDATLAFTARADALTAWRRTAKRRLPLLAEQARVRWSRVGDLAHASAPDLKEAHGGLRDVTLLRALLASWLVDVPSAELERLGRALLDIRDALQEVAGRRKSDRMVADYLAPVAAALGLDGPEALRSALLPVGRGIAHLASVALRNVDWILAPPRPVGPRRPVLDALAPGVAAYRGEVVLTEQARPRRDPLLGLRAAAAAATNNLVLSDSAAARLGRELAPLPQPWPAPARNRLVELLRAGPALPDVWEALDQYGVIETLLPEWRRVRYLAPQSPVHRWTVDRHLVQTCVELAPAAASSPRPDLLLVAALLHDIGKGDDGDHSEVGETIAHTIAGRMGFGAADAGLIATLVRHHLLLVTTATSRDLDDPATAHEVAAAVGDDVTIHLLAALTRADALATGPQAWSPWRAQLVRVLVERVRRVLRAATPVVHPSLLPR